MSPAALVRASHPLPALAVTAVMTLYALSIGWRGMSVGLLVAALLVGQLSVGWSNDAFDARSDAAARRESKPTVAGLVSPGALWWGAGLTLAASAAMSWWVAGWRGGSFHVLALVMAWTYNTALSRTIWSWVPYAVAFGAMPAFLGIGLDGTAPAPWTVAVFAIIGVSAHLANALPDIDSDAAAGLGGAAVRLGTRRSLVLCWVLLAAGTAILASVLVQTRPLVSAVIAAAYVIALVTRGRQASTAFTALLVVVGVDVVALILAGSQVR